MNKLPMPKLWRLLFQNIESLETKSPSYQRFKDCLKQKSVYEIPVDAVKTWNADQHTGRLDIVLNDDRKITASYQIIGSHDGQSFLWADANSSITDTKLSSKVRKVFYDICSELSKNDKLNLSYRDMEAVTFFGAEALNLERTFIASTGNAYLAMSLGDITLQELPIQDNPNKWSLGRLFRKKNEIAEAASPANIFDFTNVLLTDQLKAVTLDSESLEHFESQIVEINQAYENERYTEALNLIAIAKEGLGQFYQDQEPIGWLSTCEGACNLMLGQKSAAYECFQIALRAIVIPDVKLAKLGLAQASEDPDLYMSNLISLFISDPDECIKSVSEDEKEIIQNHVGAVEQKRKEALSDVESVLKAALQDRFEQEVQAFRRSKEAAKQRTQSHVLCEADEAASKITNQEYRNLLLKWFTIPRASSMGSYRSDPDENPEKLISLEVVETTNDNATVIAKFENAFGSEKDYRYELVMDSLPLSNKKMWRLHKIWSVWDDDDIQIY